MEHRHGGSDSPFDGPDDPHTHHQGHHRGHHHGKRGRHGHRPFDYGELRLLVLAMTAEQARHGYELMRAIEERMGGSYTPSPGVIYPTLSWLEDMGYAKVEAEAGRKRYSITEEGQSFLTANRAAADELLARGAQSHVGHHVGRHNEPAPVARGMENLKMALRLKLKSGPIDQATAETIAAALDAAALAIERS